MENNVTEKSVHKIFWDKSKKFDLIFDEIKDILFLHDFKGNIIKANNAACLYLGYNKDEIRTLNIFNLTSRNLFSGDIDFKELTTQKYLRFETYFLNNNEKELPIEVTSNVIEYANSKVILSCAKDISARKNIEQQLIESKHKAEDNEIELNAIFDNSPASIFVFDEEAKIIRVNKKGIEKFNIENINLNNRLGNIINCANTKDRTRKCGTTDACKTCRLNNIFNKTITEGKSFFKEEVQLLLKRNEDIIEKTALVSTCLLKKNGSSMFLLTIDDITKRKKMEQELIEAKIKAQESEKLKSAFLNNLSHEIRTPLNGILGFIDFFKEDNISLEEKNEFIKIMHKSGERLINTVNDLVNVSKINSGLMILKKEPFNLIQSIDSFFSIENLTHDKPNINFTVHIDPKLKDKLVNTDKLKLFQVLRNLLDNAFKFTSEGFVKLYVEQENDDLIFSIQDSGIGISPENHFNIFKPFWQVNLDLNRPYDGNGLGLTVAQKLASCLGTDLSVQSDIGKGSTFSFHLTNIIEKDSEIKSDDQNQTGLSSKTILICEDEITNYLYLEAILSQEKCRLIHALNGKEAVDIITKNNTIDLVLMDLRMPVMDGFEATSKIREIRNNLPIIAQSAYVLNDETEKALKAGCNEFLSKPLNKGLLIKTMKMYLNSK